MRVSDIEGIRIKLASPDVILGWSHGEVTKPETINYRTQRAEKDGLFDERIFGPEKDYECYCGKYRRIRYKGIVCDRCGVEVTKSIVRRERMGHIKLACPVSHIWFLRGIPSRMGMVIDLPMQRLEKVIYFAAYIITKVNENLKKDILDKMEQEYRQKLKQLKGASQQEGAPEKEKVKKGKKKEAGSEEMESLRKARDRAKEEISSLEPLKILSEVEFYDFSTKYGEVFEAGTGAETLRSIFAMINIKEEMVDLSKDIEEASPLNKRKLLRRMRLLQGMQTASVRPEWMFLTVLPVLPPDLRPMVQLDGGRYASSDLNDLYRRVINRNTRLKYLLEINAPEVIVRNEKRMLQEAVDALIDNSMRKGILTTATTGGRRLLKSLADMLKGKQGRFRQNLLGKRVDYSGRSVIVVGPELQLHQCGLPKKMALELFKPFVIKRILDKEFSYNVRGASRLIEQGTDDVWAILEEVVRDKLILLNRAPTLHRLGIQAFQPVLIEGESIRLHPMVCKAYNADFDGDQMAVHLPLGEEAQKEAREIMLSTLNLLKPATGTPIVSPSQDIVLGCYWLTKIRPGAKGEGKFFFNPTEALLAYDFEEIEPQAKINVLLSRGDKDQNGKLKYTETSVGRIMFNATLPQGHPFVNDLMASKRIDKLIGEIIAVYEQKIVEETLDKVKQLGFEGATMSGVTWGMDDLVVPPEKDKIIEGAEKEIDAIENHFRRGLLSKEEKSGKIIEVWTKAKSEIEKLVPKTLPQFGPIFTIVDSGARGSWSQPVQMAGMKGLVINPAGQIIELPVRSSFKEGFDVLEYFISTHGARKGTADTALRTSTAGYLTRKLVDVSHEVVVHEKDCGDKEGFEISLKDAEDIGQNPGFKLAGRITLGDINIEDKSGKKKLLVAKGEIIGWKEASLIGEAKVENLKIRSPIACRAIKGICQQCYGWDLGNNKLVKLGSAVGVVAAQAIGEPGTQLTMRTFHTGGVAGAGDITLGLPRVQEIFEARIPGGKAVISEVDGIIEEISSAGIIRIKVNPIADGKKIKEEAAKAVETVEYKVSPKVTLYVSSGQKVTRGQQLSEGNLDLKEVFKLKGKEEAQKYVLRQIQNIYVSQGAVIHDKHVEIIIRQMFSRVKIKDSGDSQFVAGDIIEKTRFLEENAELKKSKKTPAKAVAILLGISRVALTTDSFLSAASFQETSRVLIKAALEGKEDKLRGLKENVIIGKLIPAGTGFDK